MPTSSGRVFGGGELGDLVRAYNWAAHPLGPIESWPQVLVSSVNTLLNSCFPKVLYWSRERYAIYNNGYRNILGAQHTAVLGRQATEIWPEVKEYIGNMIDAVLLTCQPNFLSDHPLMITRSGFTEEAFFTFSCSPVYLEDGSCGGVLTTITETTERVISERRLRFLRDLGSRTWGKRTVDGACEAIGNAFDNDCVDTTFMLLYLPSDDQTKLVLRKHSNIAPSHIACAAEVHIDTPVIDSLWPISSVIQERKIQLVNNIDQLFGAHFPSDQRGGSTVFAALCPIICTWSERAVGVLIVGLNPYLPLNEAYRTHLELVVGQVSSAINTAKSSSDDQKRVQMLAELDKAKTIFFSNVSHELRTPLTLVLGALEQIALDQGHPLHSSQIDHLHLAQRNSGRLLKLVNTLLDYSRIEAGRLTACYVPVDLGTITIDLANMFQSLMESGGLTYNIVVGNLDQLVFVDVDLWEKIVLNLLSNAFKFTLHGSVTIELEQGVMPTTMAVEGAGGTPAAVLRVSDTGCGIAADKIGHLFERFYRVEASQGRSYEGSGIGLALTNELLKLHGGCIEVNSIEGQGTTFKAYIPFGSSHLPVEQVNSMPTPQAEIHDRNKSKFGAPFVEEALHWLVSKPILQAGGAYASTIPLTRSNGSDSGVIESAAISNNSSASPNSITSTTDAHHNALAPGAAALDPSSLEPQYPQQQQETATTATQHLTPGQHELCLGRPHSASSTHAVPAEAETAMGWTPAATEDAEDEYSLSTQTIYRHILSNRRSGRRKPVVLIVDDNADMRMFLVSLLKHEYTVLTASDGQDALDCILSPTLNRPYAEVPDVVVADVMMPRLDGLGMVHHLRQHDRSRHLPIILLSALTGEDARVEGLRSGADDYLCKPFSAKELMERVRTHLNLSLLRNHLEELVQKRTRELLDSQQQYRGLVHLSPVGIYRSDPEGRILLANERWFEIIGLPSTTSLANGAFTMSEWVHDDDRANFKHSVHELDLLVQREFRLVRSSDRAVIFVCGQSVADIDPLTMVVRGYVSVLTDITEQKRLNAEHLSALTRAEQEAQERATEADENRRQQELFVDMICHEIRNPLNGISNNTDLLQTNAYRRRELLYTLQASPARQELLNIATDDLSIFASIDTCIQHQRKVTDDVLNLSRLSSGNVVLNVEPVQPAVLIKSIVDMFAAQARTHSVSLTTELPRAPWDRIIVECDPYRVSQVVVNLISNAIKFTMKTTTRQVCVRLEMCLSASSGNHDVNLSGEKATMRISVQDTGIGITNDELASLFQRFRQANSKTYSRYGGSGLGLHISKLLLTLMGGDIDVTSEPHKGSCFTLTIPCRICSSPGVSPALVDSSTLFSVASSTLEEIKRRANLPRTSSVSEVTGTVAQGQYIQGSISSESIASNLSSSSDALATAIPASLSSTTGAAVSGTNTPTRTSHKRPRPEIECLNILIVEDNDINQRVLRRQLEAATEFSCRIYMVDNGQQAVDIYERGEQFDLILMDVEMPVMDGLEATRRIRKLATAANRPLVPIIGVSGNARDVHINAGVAAGMTAYLVKPYKKEQLVQLVMSVLHLGTPGTTTHHHLLPTPTPAQ